MDTQDESSSQHILITAFAAKLRRESGPVRIFGTHISCVLVAGEYAYKFKQAVRFGFLDFSTLEKRRFYCNEELRLNRRLAPEIYLGVVTFSGSPEDPVIDAVEPAIEYAVKMRAFSQDALWSHRIEKGVLTASEIDRLAQRLFAFHRDAAIAMGQSPWGTPDALAQILEENFSELAILADDASAKTDIAKLGAALAMLGKELHPAFMERKANGKIKECHGDLHSENVITLDDQVTAFDCIEFNDGMRWIDVMNDIAFICMDLEYRKRNDLAARLLSAYLEMSGDYEGLSVFRYYKTQRAVIRCKVSWLRALQLDQTGENASTDQAAGRAYLSFAGESIRRARPVIMITHGLAGSGKTTFSMTIVEIAGAVQIRSDVERKRLHGLAATDRSWAESSELYSSASTEKTYAHLLRLAEQVVTAGWPVIIDAAFLQRGQRRPFKMLASRLGLPFFIFDIHATEDTLKRRVAVREKENRDASDADMQVLLHQLAHVEPLAADEIIDCVRIDTDSGVDPDAIRRRCEPILRLRQR